MKHLNFKCQIDGCLKPISKQDENYEKIKEIREDNIDAANRQLKSRKKADCRYTDSNI
jgi:hypothetical protein